MTEQTFDKEHSPEVLRHDKVERALGVMIHVPLNEALAKVGLMIVEGWEEITDKHRDGERWLFWRDGEISEAEWLPKENTFGDPDSWSYPSLEDGYESEYRPTHAMPTPQLKATND